MSLCGSFHCYHVLQNWHKIEDDLMQPEESFCSMRCSACQKKTKKKPGRNSAQSECSHNVAHLIMLHTSQSIKKNVCSTSCFWFVVSAKTMKRWWTSCWTVHVCLTDGGKESAAAYSWKMLNSDNAHASWVISESDPFIFYFFDESVLPQSVRLPVCALCQMLYEISTTFSKHL